MKAKAKRRTFFSVLSSEECFSSEDSFSNLLRWVIRRSRPKTKTKVLVSDSDMSKDNCLLERWRDGSPIQFKLNKELKEWNRLK